MLALVSSCLALAQNTQGSGLVEDFKVTSGKRVILVVLGWMNIEVVEAARMNGNKHMMANVCNWGETG